MTTHKQYLTEEGVGKLQAELDSLIATRRPVVADRVEKARELGNTEDNEYDDAKNEQAFVEGRILELEDILKNAEVIRDDATPSAFIKIGSNVTVKTDDGKEQTYKIVGSAEADAKERRISNESPVGLALLGHKAGETVQVVAPAGIRKLKVVKIE